MRIETYSVNTIPSGYGAKGNLDQYAHTSDFYNHSTNTSSYGHIVLKNNTTPAYGELTFNTPTVHPLGRIKSVTVTARIGFRSDSRMLTAWFELYMNGNMKGERQNVDITKNSNKLYTLTATNISQSDLNDIRLRVGGTTKYNAIAIGITEYRSIFVYGVDIDIEYDLYYYQVTATLENAVETLNNGVIEGLETTDVQAAFRKDGVGNLLSIFKVEREDFYPEFTQEGEPYVKFSNINSDHTLVCKYSAEKMYQKSIETWTDVLRVFIRVDGEWKCIPLKNFKDYKNHTLLYDAEESNVDDNNRIMTKSLAKGTYKIVYVDENNNQLPNVDEIIEFTL